MAIKRSRIAHDETTEEGNHELHYVYERMVWRLLRSDCMLLSRLALYCRADTVHDLG